MIIKNNMGGGDLLPCAATVQGLMNAASTAQAQGNLNGAAGKYREAGEALQRLAKSGGLSRDEVYSLELQSSELMERARELEAHFSSRATPSIASTGPTGLQGPNATPQQIVQESKTSDRVGAAAVGAVAGFTFGGMIGMPVFGMLAGGAAGGITACREDEMGEKARHIGKYGASAIDEAKNLEKKYNISGNTKVAIQSAVYKAKELNEKHDIAGKAATAAKLTVEKAAELNTKYQITDNVAKAISTGLDKLNAALKPEPKP